MAGQSQIIAIPDVFGEIDQLDRVLTVIDRKWPAAKIVFLGNYINHGPDPANVLKRVREYTERGHVALRGSYEEMFLDYLCEEETDFLNPCHGAGSTLRSLEREADTEFSDPRELTRYLAGNGMIEWLSELPVFPTQTTNRLT